MRISLLYHAGAGDGVSLESLVGALEKAGHAIDRVIEKGTDFDGTLEASTEVLVAAGGDGTVRRAACALAGTEVALAILPLGTANNVARSLGIGGSIPRLIDGWNTARRLPLDIGSVRNRSGVSRFLEGVGAGLIPTAITAVKAHGHDMSEQSAVRLDQAARRFLDVLDYLEPHRSAITLDGVRSEGEFLVLEVLNTPSVGPNLLLSEEAHPSDGFLSVVAIEATHRQQLHDSLSSRIEGSECGISFPARHAREIEVEGWSEMHVDGNVHRSAEMSPVSIRVNPGAVKFLSNGSR